MKMVGAPAIWDIAKGNPAIWDNADSPGNPGHGRERPSANNGAAQVQSGLTHTSPISTLIV